MVYVSTVCPPYPQGASIEAPDAALDGGDPCVAAFSALAGAATCGNDAAGAGDDGGADAADGGPAETLEGGPEAG